MYDALPIKLNPKSGFFFLLLLPERTSSSEVRSCPWPWVPCEITDDYLAFLGHRQVLRWALWTSTAGAKRVNDSEALLTSLLTLPPMVRQTLLICSENYWWAMHVLEKTCLSGCEAVLKRGHRGPSVYRHGRSLPWPFHSWWCFHVGAAVSEVT